MRQSMVSTSITTFVALLLTCSVYANEADTKSTFTPLEMKWLRAGWPVLSYADDQHLPIDIIVQSQAAAGEVPFAMGVENGRCKLVLSMRGNPEAEAPIANLPTELQALAIEAMTAHEMAHCWRYMNGMWHALPAGFLDAGQETDRDTKLAAMQQAMSETRREEGFADLVGLAWTLRTHPEHYAAIHAWFERVRAAEPISGSHHDTRIWLQLAAQPQNFPSAASLFEQANHLWAQGLQSK